MNTNDVMPRRFLLRREEDVNGSSGTGNVAYGVEFNDGHVALRWNLGVAGAASSGFYSSIADVDKIHGHEGRTKVEWIDG